LIDENSKNAEAVTQTKVLLE